MNAIPIAIMLFILIPTTTYAIEKLTIEISTNIEISTEDKQTNIYHCGYNGDTEYQQEGVTTITYKNGMTWEEFFNSEYADLLDAWMLDKLPEYSQYLMDEYETCTEEHDKEYCYNEYLKTYSQTDKILSLGQNGKTGYYGSGECK